MKLSIVATLYQSASYIEEFYRRASEIAKSESGDDYEIILVNDGSPDSSLDIAVCLADQDPHLIVIDLSRNFGHHKAMMTGLAHANGERIFLIDSDLEEEPEWLEEFSTLMEENSCDMVYGVQGSRKGDWFERFSGWLFYKMFNSLTGLNLPKNPVTARLMSRQFVNELLRHEEREISIGGLFLITGFKQIPVKVQKHDSSESTYSFRHKMAVFVDSITSFSSKPLISIFYVGFAIFIIASLSVAYLVVARLFFATPLSGWTSLMASIWLLGGLIVMFIGVVGIYLSKVFSEAKRRPNSIIRQIYRSEEQIRDDQNRAAKSMNAGNSTS